MTYSAFRAELEFDIGARGLTDEQIDTLIELLDLHDGSIGLSPAGRLEALVAARRSAEE